jgi:histidine ammonia-lyase
VNKNFDINENKGHFDFDDASRIEYVEMGQQLTISDLTAIARYYAKVSFSESYVARVKKARNLVVKWIDEGRVMYGITTGFGVLCNQLISKEETETLQKNIVLSHSTSVGSPMPIEAVRAIMVMMLSNMGQGYSGVSVELLERIKDMLNLRITPYVPTEGSVGYLSVEAHIGLSLIGLGKVYYEDQLRPTEAVFQNLNIDPYVLKAKEGLSLTSGTTSPTALAALTMYDLSKAVMIADVIGAMSLEVTKGTLKAFDERLMRARPYQEQTETADNVRYILKDSQIAKEHINYRLQDALSIRAIPQLHGAVKRTLNDAIKTIQEEMNFTGDNPIIWPEGDDGLALSGCHCDASYVGLAMDASSIAATVLAKMSERRNFRMISGQFSEMPWFLISNPGLNSGLMIPQYTQAALLNDMKMLSIPATIDNIPTCGGQEDYISMGYNASKKAYQIVEKLEYILAIELLSAYQAYQFQNPNLQPGTISQSVINLIGEKVPFLSEDEQLSPHIEFIKKLIHSGDMLRVIQ